MTKFVALFRRKVVCIDAQRPYLPRPVSQAVLLPKDGTKEAAPPFQFLGDYSHERVKLRYMYRYMPKSKDQMEELRSVVDELRTQLDSQSAELHDRLDFADW
ncbi:hypothetical protein ACFL3B_03295 [Gemmatimonadota bacterium]